MTDKFARTNHVANRTTFERLVDRIFGNDHTYAAKHQPFDAIHRTYESESAKRVISSSVNPVRFMIGSPARDVILTDADGNDLRLQELAGSTTVVLMLDSTISSAPGLSHRIMRRAESLGTGVHLICVAESAEAAGRIGLVDKELSLRAIAGGSEAPFLLSLDGRGVAFDLVTDREAIMNWLWNEPRPHSMHVGFQANAEIATQ